MTRLTVGLMVFPRFEMLDAYGPLQMFSMLRDDFKILTIGPDLTPVASNGGGPATLPDHGFGDAPQVDILLVPGGTGARDVIGQPDWLDWVARQAKGAQWVTSVCTGSLILAQAGVLAGHKATTNKLAFDWVRDQTGGVDWQPVARWVVDGNVLTSSGVSAGMDMALDLIARIKGPDAAAQAALMAEYERNHDPDTDPFARHP